MLLYMCVYIYNVTNWRKPSKPCVQGVSLGLGLFRSGSGARGGVGERLKNYLEASCTKQATLISFVQ